jgi:membrane protease YdiL (CAAX protease family)
VRPPHPGFWWSVLWCIAFLLFTQVPGGVVAGIMLAIELFTNPAYAQQAQGEAGVQQALLQSPAMSRALGVGFVINEILGIAFSWLVLRLIVGREWPRHLALRRPGLAHLVLVLLSFPAVVLLANWAYMVLRTVLHVPSLGDFGLGGMDEMVKLFNDWPAPFAVLVIGVGPGIGEELWCRGFLGRGLVGRYGALGVVATSFFFGLIHIDPAQGTMAMLMGLWLHFIYLTTRSLWVPMLTHFLNNSVAVVAGHFAVLEGVDNPAAVPPLVYAASALLLAGVGWALYQSRARLVAADGDGPPPWRSPFPGVEYPPPGSGTRVVHPTPAAVPAAVAVAGFLLFVASCYFSFGR